MEVSGIKEIENERAREQEKDGEWRKEGERKGFLADNSWSLHICIQLRIYLTFAK